MNEPLQRQNPSREEVVKITLQAVSQFILLILGYLLLKG